MGYKLLSFRQGLSRHKVSHREDNAQLLGIIQRTSRPIDARITDRRHLANHSIGRAQKSIYIVFASPTK